MNCTIVGITRRKITVSRWMLESTLFILCFCKVNSILVNRLWYHSCSSNWVYAKLRDKNNWWREYKHSATVVTYGNQSSAKFFSARIYSSITISYHHKLCIRHHRYLMWKPQVYPWHLKSKPPPVGHHNNKISKRKIDLQQAPIAELLRINNRY